MDVTLDGVPQKLYRYDVDDTPVDAATDVPPSSNWAFDHADDLDAHVRAIHELVKIGVYAPSELMATYRGINEDTLIASRLYAMAYPMSRNRTPDEIYVTVNTASAGDSLRLGIYADDGNCYPGALIVDIGVVSVNANGLKTIAYTTQLVKGLYWIAGVSDGTPKISATLYHLQLAGDGTGYEGIAGYNVGQAYGALPATYPPAAATNTRLWMCGFKWASND